MINFRYHLVSLTAVFLALAIGIAMGATVVDQATVKLLRNQLDSVRTRANNTNTQNDALRAEASRWRRFADQGDELVRGVLAGGPPVLIVASRGVDHGTIDALRRTLTTAGATVEGTVWFTAKFRLDKPDDAQTLSTVLGATAKPDALRHAALVSLAGAWAAGSGSGPLPGLHDAGFVDFDPPAPGQATDLSAVPVPHSQFVVVSDATPDVPNEQVAVPFATELVHDAPATVVVAEPGRDAAPKVPAQRAIFLHPLRGDATLTGRMSTVDNVEDFRGRMATVLALVGLRSGSTGNYGVGPGADRLLPEPPK
jgi:hypothetical protein